MESTGEMRGRWDMLYVVTGGSGSGKSVYAEQLAVTIFKRKRDENKSRSVEMPRLYYIATMHPADEECLNRIKRHREMRKDKGFITIERSVGLEQINAGKQDIVLIECMSNLLANEMYLADGRIRRNGQYAEAEEQLKNAVFYPMKRLAENAGCVIVVTNEVFSEGKHYDEETERYCRLLGTINSWLGKLADGLVEVVCAIPLYRKGEIPCLNQ